MERRRWLTVKECAAYLSLHEVTVRRLIDRGQLPARRFGRNVRIDLRLLEAPAEAAE